MIVATLGAHIADEAVFQVRRQLEMMIAADLGQKDAKPLKTWASAREIVAGRPAGMSKLSSLYTGFVSHSSELLRA